MKASDFASPTQSADLVSVLVPSFNYGWILAETLDSLLAQTHTNWECLIIDDGSTDNTRVVAEGYQQQDSRFRYVYQQNAGLSAARNTGLALASGKYIQLLDADDLLEAHKLATQVAYLEAHPTIDLVYGDVQYFMHGRPEVQSRSLDMQDRQWVSQVPEAGNELLQALLRGNIMVVNSPLLRAELTSKVGTFNPALKSMEDWDYWLRCALAGAHFHYSSAPDVRAWVRVHPTSMSQNITRMYKFELAIRYQLRPVLQATASAAVVGANEQGIASAIHIITDRARQKVLEGEWKVGVQEYMYLARTTKKYSFYGKTMLYWLRKRLLAKL